MTLLSLSLLTEVNGNKQYLSMQTFIYIMDLTQSFGRGVKSITVVFITQVKV